MDVGTLISILAGIVTITTGVVALVRYLQRRQRNVLSLSAWSLNMAKKYQEAISVCEEALRKNPKDASAYENLSWALNALGRHPEALEASDRAIAIKASAGAYNNRGWAFQAMGHSLFIDPGFVPAYKGKGKVLQRQGKLTEAQQAFEQAQHLERSKQ